MIPPLIKLLRPHQWTKNTLCFAGAIFGGQFFEPRSLLLDLYTFGVFCVASSAVYVLNDIADRELDRQHPKKRNRPIASGAVSVRTAAVLGTLLAVAAVAGAGALGRPTLTCLVLFFGNNVLYSVSLRKFVLLDVISIAFGFVLRILAGIYVLGDLPTAWIVMCVFFLALFLGFAKRRAELCGLGQQENAPRPVLARYTIKYLDMLINSAATITIMSYTLFTVTSGKNPTLVITFPLVYYAIMHYKRLVIIREVGDEPDKILLKERRIPACILLWLAAYVAVEYGNLHLFR